MRAIDADSVLRQMMRGYELMMEQMADRSSEVRGAMEDARLLFTYAVHDEPTLDVVPVRHGRWVRCKGKSTLWHCSECGERIIYNPTRKTYNIRKKNVAEVNKFCRACGAKMDAGQEDENNGENMDE